MDEDKIKRLMISTEIPMTYMHLNAEQGKPLVIMFHGFADSANAFLKRAFNGDVDKYEILAINGLFPLPQKKENEWRPAYAWYFADFDKNKIHIHPDVAAKAVGHLIHNLGLQLRQKMILAFSQGGYFLPFVLPQLENTKYVLSIGAAYRSQDYSTMINHTFDALHGGEDEVIPFLHAEKTFTDLKKIKNLNGEFIKINNLGHTLNDEVRILIQKKLNHYGYE